MKTRGETVFGLVLLLVFAAGIILSMDWSAKARLFPLAITIGGVGASFVLLFLGPKSAVQEQHDEASSDGADTKTKVTTRSELTMILWILAFLVLILLVGFWVTMATFIPCFMLIFGHERIRTVALFTVTLWILMYGIFHIGLGIPLHGGIMGWSFL